MEGEMLVLVTGIGNVGKSHYRRLLVQTLRSNRFKAEHFDVDRFAELRDQTDSDLLTILPDCLEDDVIYIVEDVHAPTDQALLPLERYDLIFLVTTDLRSHLRFWFGRARHWHKDGKFDWDPETGFKGSGRSNDWRNLPKIVRTVLRHLAHRKHLEHDRVSLSGCGVITQKVESVWSKNGPVFPPISLMLFPPL